MKKKTTVLSRAIEYHHNPSLLLRTVLVVAAFIFTFIVLDFFSQQFEELRGIVSWYPPAGLIYALLLVFGMRFMPVVTISLFISSIFIYRMPQPNYLLLLWAFIISLIYSLTAMFLRKRVLFDWRLGKLRDVTWLVFTTVLVSALLAVLSVSSSALSSNIPRSEVLNAIFHWWIGETVGVLTVTPFLLIFVMPSLKRFVEGQPVRLPAHWSIPRPKLSVIGQAFSIVFTLYFVFGIQVLNEFHPMYLIILPLIWITLQNGFKGATAGIVALNFGVVLTQWFFKFDIARLGELQLVMIVNCIVGLLMGSVIADRKLAKDALMKSEEKDRLLVEEKGKQAAELVIANKELAFQNEEKGKRAAELVIANSELAFQSGEKDKRAAELVIANKELAFQNGEKDKRAAELVIANKELAFQSEEKDKRAAELITVNNELAFQNEEKGKRANELIAVNNELSLQNEEVLYLSYHDQLTGLFNRRFYETELKRLDTKRNFPITIVMGDVNGLKLINDSFGHAMGDDLLKKAAEVIKKGCRADDIIARHGGDEFVILLPKSNVFETEQIIKRINALASKEKIGTIDISISFGFDIKKYEGEKIQEVFKKAEDNMYRHKLSESTSMRSKTLDVIMKTLYEKSNREMAHSKRVSGICEAIANKMNLDKDDVNQIRTSGLMHDIGKIGVDEKILNKTGKLNDDEWKEIKKHPEIGYRILSSVNEFSALAEDVLEHHERWDGKGYPKGLKSEEITLQARIIAVADAFDAMTGQRTYSQPLSELEAMKEIRRCSGKQFSPDIARVFIEKVLGKEWEEIYKI
jgi:diguanylate cyclase (GGDEF)-like protein/putative nucleotidyltransferase with HDIG domain